MVRTASARAARCAAGLGRACRRLATDTRAVTVVEYGLMAALIVVAIVAGVSGYAAGLGGMMSSSFSQIAATM